MTYTFDHVADAGRSPAFENLPNPLPPNPYAHGLKRAFDIVIVLAALPFALPLILVAAALAALDGNSPFFRQVRLGRGGRTFSLLKIRTMVPNAEARLAALLAASPEAASEWNETQKLRNDPRITRVGAFLRATSLDELPQLLNVLTGDMSLIGPRPMLPEQRQLYAGSAYEMLRPGVTGLWQTEARNNSSFAARASYDTQYANSLTFATDLRILLKTVQVVLKRTGC